MPMSRHDATLALQQETANVRVGVCGFCLPQAELFAQIRLLEVQQTFYKPPQLKTVERWRRAAPVDFEFTLKAFQAITHPVNPKTYRRTNLSVDEQAQCGNFRDTPVVRDAWAVTRRLAAALKAEWVVFQCPPGFQATEEHLTQLRQFFEWAPRDRLSFTWEPRHASWAPALIAGLCRELELVHAVDPLEQASATPPPHYFRLHGGRLGGFRYEYNHPYSDAELVEIRNACAAGPTWCLFNNIQMATDARRLTLRPPEAA
jgi:uncharacterized protein YecE (DUF72 family)